MVPSVAARTAGDMTDLRLVDLEAIFALHA